MPRDDLSIDFVSRRMPPGESIDPALILDEWINRVQNLPEEIRFIQDEIQEKDRIYNECVKTIEERDARIQKWIKSNGSHENNPREANYRQTIRENFAKAEKLAEEKIILTNKLQYIIDKHVRSLDIQIKMMYDRNEPGFTDPDELPSLVRASAANQHQPTGLPATNPVTAALNPIPNNASQSAIRAANPQIRNTQSQQQVSASAPATPAASMILNRKERENSAGPGSGVPTRKPPRSVTGLANAPTTSSGLARPSSLGPGTPKLANQHHGAAAAHIQRAGSAGPRASSKGGVAGVRKSSTPVPGRKKGTPVPPGTKSGLSRVKRASKNSPSSNAESDLSDAVSGSGDESDARTGGRGTPAAASNRGGSGPSNVDGSHDKEGSTRPSAGHSRSNSGIRRDHRRALDAEDGDEMDVDDEEAGDDRKYCICQAVSYGDMVACDNEQCPYEWFHWSCVGLKAEPTGTWFCPVCTEERKRKGLKT
jgi:inhibitor of growth protein 3